MGSDEVDAVTFGAEEGARKEESGGPKGWLPLATKRLASSDVKEHGIVDFVDEVDPVDEVDT